MSEEMNSFEKLVVRAGRKGIRTLRRGKDRLEEGTEVLLEAGGKLREEAIELMDSHEKHIPVWSGLDTIPSGPAPDTVVPGCIVLEGGSFRGVYTSGVLDVLMENGINLQTTVGTSAGALNGFNYVAGCIGRSARINLGYRHDSRYFGVRSTAKSRGVVGFSFILDEIESELPFDWDRFNDPARRFLVTVTRCDNGECMYREKDGTRAILKSVQASATMPFVSEPVDVDGVPCYDGGMAVKIPYRWALDNGFGRVLVIRTRPRAFRRPPESQRFCEISRLVYKDSPELVSELCGQAEQYNAACDELEELEKEGKIFMLCPSGPIQTATLEGDMEKLGALYLLGRADVQLQLPAIKAYLGLE